MLYYLKDYLKGQCTPVLFILKPFKFLRNLTAYYFTFVRYIMCALVHTASLDITCKQIVTMKHGDLDCRLSTAIDYPFRELVFRKEQEIQRFVVFS